MDAVSATPGMELALDWLAAIEQAGSANRGLSGDERRTYADADLRAIREGDALWFLSPTTETRGAWLELGYAIGHLASHRAYIVASGDSGQSIFCALVTEVSTDAEALDYLRGLMVEGDSCL
jgi:hypothetical protein